MSLTDVQEFLHEFVVFLVDVLGITDVDVLVKYVRHAGHNIHESFRLGGGASPKSW